MKECTCCRSGALISGQRSKTLVSCAGGSCKSTLKDCGFVLWQHFTNPSHTFGYFHTCRSEQGRKLASAQGFFHLSCEISDKTKVVPTCLTMRRDRMFMTKPPSRGYMVRDWITVRMSSMGRGLCSISCCITTARTSDVYTFFSPKQRLVAVRQMRKINR